MKFSLVRFSGGHDADIPAHIREKMATNWYLRTFNSYTTRGRANTVMGVLAGWFLFGYTMKKWSQSRSASKLASEPPKAAASTSHAAPAKKGGHH